MRKNIVLCCDDEPIVLRFSSIAIAEAGFCPVVAENGVAGLQVFTQLKDQICLVLADVIMPALGGIQMAEAIQRIDPLAKILLMSGYSDNVIQLQGTHRFPFVRKPFIQGQLIQKIRCVIGDSDVATASGT